MMAHDHAGRTGKCPQNMPGLTSPFNQPVPGTEGCGAQAVDQWPERARVFCLGSAHGDDQVGWRVGDSLRTANSVAATETHLLNHAWQLASHLECGLRVIIVDACFTRNVTDADQSCMTPPGTVFRFGWPDSRLLQLRSHSTHGSSVSEALELSARLGCLPEEVVVFAVAAREFAPASPPSSDVLAAVPEVTRLIRLELARWREGSFAAVE